MTVLLVNDEPDDLFLWKRALRRRLPTVQLAEASSATDALAFLSAFEVAAIVTDNRMPVMDGIELVQEIRARDREIPIVMVTGMLNSEAAARRAGVTAFVTAGKWDETAAEVARILSP